MWTGPPAGILYGMASSDDQWSPYAGSAPKDPAGSDGGGDARFPYGPGKDLAAPPFEPQPGYTARAGSAGKGPAPSAAGSASSAPSSSEAAPSGPQPGYTARAELGGRGTAPAAPNRRRSPGTAQSGAGARSAGSRARLGMGKVKAYAAAAIALAVVAAYVLGRSAPTAEPPREQGYTGWAQDSGHPAAAWARGVDVAWRIDAPGEGNTRPRGRVLRYGSTVIAVDSGEDLAARVTAIDASGAQPVTLWTTNPRDTDLMSDASPLVVGDELVMPGAVIDLATGSASEAPWGRDDTLAYASGVLVTCTGKETCSGWTRSEAVWERQWRVIAEQPDYRTQLWDRSVLRAGPEDDTWLLISNDPQGEASVLRATTGEVRTIAPAPAKGAYAVRTAYGASDGWVLVDVNTKEAVAFSPEGEQSGTFPVTEPVGSGSTTRTVTAGDGRPTVDGVKRFLTTGRAPWSDGTVWMDGKDCTTVNFAPSEDRKPVAAAVEKEAGLANGSSGACTLVFSHAVAGEGDSVLFVQQGVDPDRKKALIDMSAGGVVGSEELSGMATPTWVYDDLIVGIDATGIVALTPKDA